MSGSAWYLFRPYDGRIAYLATMTDAHTGRPVVRMADGERETVRMRQKTYSGGSSGGDFATDRNAQAYARAIVKSRSADGFTTVWSSDFPCHFDDSLPRLPTAVPEWFTFAIGSWWTAPRGVTVVSLPLPGQKPKPPTTRSAHASDDDSPANLSALKKKLLDKVKKKSHSRFGVATTDEKEEDGDGGIKPRFSYRPVK